MTAEVSQVAHDASPLGFTVVVIALIMFSTTAPDLPLPDELPQPPDLTTDTIGQSEIKLLLSVTMAAQLVVVTIVVAFSLVAVGALIVRRETIVQYTQFLSGRS